MADKYKIYHEALYKSHGKGPISKEECEKFILENNLNEGKPLHSASWKALLAHGLLKKGEGDFFIIAPWAEKVKSASASASDSDKKTLRINKNNNQYYAQYVEEAVVAVINKTEIPNNIKGFRFKEWELEIMNEDAKNIASFLNGSSAVYVGRKTKFEDCDIIVDGKRIELKYCKKNNATYYNTTVSYFDSYGLDTLKSYMLKHKVYDLLVPYFGAKVFQNTSPVSNKESSAFRESHKGFYEDVYVHAERKARAEYSKMVFDFFSTNKEFQDKLVKDMLTKAPSEKNPPELLVVYHHDIDEIVQFTREEILSITNQNFRMGGDFSLKFDDFHITIAWQNGTGLSNPTIRVFLDKKGVTNVQFR